jgi:hypothetical protein
MLSHYLSVYVSDNHDHAWPLAFAESANWRSRQGMTELIIKVTQAKASDLFQLLFKQPALFNLL